MWRSVLFILNIITVISLISCAEMQAELEAQAQTIQEQESVWRFIGRGTYLRTLINDKHTCYIIQGEGNGFVSGGTTGSIDNHAISISCVAN